MDPAWRITPHRSGDWLLEAAGRRYALPAEVGRRLLPLAGSRPAAEQVLARLDLPAAAAPAPPPTPGPRGRRRPLWLRVPLLPASRVRPLAGWLAPLTAWPGLAGLGLLGVAGIVAALRLPGPAAGGADWPAAVGLFLLTALLHELGHAAALAREGFPPGGVGAGVLFVVPVLFADVSAAGALPRGGRLRVDLAGPVFQLAAAGLLLAVGGIAGRRAVLLAGVSGCAAVLWSLLPLVRADGYWLLADALEVADLDRPLPAGRSRVLAGFLVGYRLLNLLALLALAVWLPWRWSARLAAWWPAGTAWTWGGRVLLAAAALLIARRTLGHAAAWLSASRADRRRAAGGQQSG